MNIGNKLRSLREHYGYSQSDLGRKLDVPPRNISNYETISAPSGVLEYITMFCNFLKIPVAEFFMEDVEDLKRELPDYITASDAAILKILNTAVDAKTRIEVKSAFVHIMKAVISQYKDRLAHMPELQEVFREDTNYQQSEETVVSSLHDEDKTKK